MLSKKHTNLKTVIKQSFWSGISQPSTFIMFVIFGAMAIILLIVVPCFLLNEAGPMYISNMFYPSALFIAIVTVMVTINSFSVNEMTFVLSRPIGRTHYLIGKYIASLLITIPMFLIVFLSFVAAWIIFKMGGVDVFYNNSAKLNWAMPILSPLSCWLSTIATAIFLRMLLQKDRLISVICTWIAIAVFLLYNIITSVTSRDTFDPTIAYILIPLLVYGTFFIVFGTLSFIWIKKYNVKV